MKRGDKVGMSASTSTLRPPLMPNHMRSPSLPNSNLTSSDPTVMRRKKRFLGPATAERLKKIKRNGSAFISNVPIIGPGSPKPTVITQLPERQQKKIEQSLVLLGAEKAGKTSLVERYIQKAFFSENQPTIAPRFYARNVYDDIDGTKIRVRLQLWDMPGSDIMRPIVSTWAQSANVAFVLFSLSDQSGESFEESKDLVRMVHTANKQSQVFIVLVGTKLDEIESSQNIRRVKQREIQEYVAETKISYCEISSRTGRGVEELFKLLVDNIKEKIIQSERIAPPPWIPDRQSSRCTNCNCSWSVTNRRHHCRKCGEVFCSKCAYKFIPIPQIGKLTPTRVCNKCFDEVMGTSSPL